MSLSALKALFDGELPKAVLFDLDGTLVDSVPDLALAIDLALGDVGLPLVGVDRVRNWVGNGAHILVQRAFECAIQMHDDVGKFNAINIESQLYERFLFHYGHLPADKKVSCLYQGVMALLQSLANNSVAMALVTNKPAAFTPAILHDFAIDHFFRVTVCGDTLSDKKPSPLPLQYACKQLGLSVNDCLMVGDSRNDIQAAKACGMKCVSVAWGYNFSEDSIIFYTQKMVI